MKRTARDLGISTNTVNTWKKYLLEHQWIEVKKRGNKETDVIYVSIGYPDPKVSVPEYLRDEWEDWNEFLKDNREFSKLGNAIDEQFDPSIGNLNSNEEQETLIEETRELPVAV